MKQTPSVNTQLHQRLRLGLENALDEKQWRVADLARQSSLSNSTLGAFLNGLKGIGVDSLDRCIRSLGLTTDEFLQRCDPGWQAHHVHIGVQKEALPHDSSPDPARQAAIETLQAAIDVAAQLIAAQPAPTAASTARTLLRRRRR